MKFGSVCSGIEAASVAWHPLGWRAAFFSEIEPFPRAVLAHRFPDVPLHGDFTTIGADDYGAIDLLVGGTPCQSFSVAGLRGGLADDRGNLALEFLRLAQRKRPRWLVWENVPGVLSSNGGRDFGAILGGMVELGYGFAYRVLDAQYFGVAQRRRRVFVVGYLGDWRPAAAVLFERASMSGHPAPRREAGQRPAPSLAARTRGGGGLGTDCELDGGLIVSTGDRTHCLNAGGMGRQDYETETLIAGTLATGGNGRAFPGTSAQDAGEGYLVAHTLRAEGFDASEDGTGRGTPLVPIGVDLYNGALTGGIAATMGTRGSSETASGPQVMVHAPSAPHAFDARQSDVVQYGDRAGPLDTCGFSQAVTFSAKDHGADAGDIAPTLRAMDHAGSHANGGGQVAVAPTLRASMGSGTTGNHWDGQVTVATMMAVRRLTPRECERLQGFPDDWTLIPWRGKPADECPDGPRYKALGNSMAVPVMRWIGERIAAVERELRAAARAEVERLRGERDALQSAAREYLEALEAGR